MSLPPSIVDVTVARGGGPRRHVWLPVFVLWPLLAFLGVLALAMTLLVDGVLRVAGRTGWRWTALVVGALAAVVEARGLRVSVNGERATVDLVVK